MTYWQVHADLGGGRSVMFGVSAADHETAAALASEVIGDKTALVTVSEIPSPLERVSL